MPYPSNLRDPRPWPEERRRICALQPQGTQMVDIIILKEELYNDIDTDSIALQRARSTPERELTHIAADDKNRYRIDRYIDRFLNEGVQRMTAYLAIPSPYAHRIANDHTKSWKEKDILLALPPTWPPHLIDALRDAVHDRIVKGVEFELFKISIGANDPTVQQIGLDADDADRDISVIINSRYNPAQDSGHPLL